ncbi:MAG TPA: hypothetical protein EYQ14_23040 [Gammaproteobacteria bacterium]|nr:hypothetical protein [Gammaproteobacteria bacterium]
MLKKLLIPMGLVSALGASTAMAAIDLDELVAASVGTRVIATDSISAVNKTTGTGANVGSTYYRVENVTNQLDAEVVAGVGFSVGDQYWVRFDLTGAAFSTVIAAGNLIVGATADPMDAIAQGGQVGTSSVIFTTTATNAVDQSDVFTFATANYGWDATSAATITSGIYEALSDATNQTNVIVTANATMLVGAQGSVVVSTPVNSITAQVQTLFTTFDLNGNAASYSADLGEILATTASATNGARDHLTLVVHALADSVTAGAATSLTTISGDFSFGSWSVSDDDCVTATVPITVAALTLNAAMDTATVPAANFATGTGASLCVTLDATAGEVAPVASAYTASLALTSADATFIAPLAAQSGSFGGIAHNGTTVELPYLTTFEDYNQRLVIVNRGSTDAGYTTTFTSEADATATAGTAASGTVAAGTTMSIKVSDMVTMTGKTRTAGTLVIVAPDASVSVATNQVNLSDGSTDTVVVN